MLLATLSLLVTCAIQFVDVFRNARVYLYWNFCFRHGYVVKYFPAFRAGSQLILEVGLHACLLKIVEEEEVMKISS